MSEDYVTSVRMPNATVLLYAIEHVPSGRFYVGSTVEPRRRWRNHLRLLRSGCHTSFLLQRAWNKYGPEEFVYRALAVCHQEIRNLQEKRLINAVGFFNLMKEVGAPPAGSMAGKKHTETARKNLKKGALSRWQKAREQHYDPLCEKAYSLCEQGVPRYKACVAVGISHSTFWKWLNQKGLVRGQNA